MENFVILQGKSVILCRFQKTYCSGESLLTFTGSRELYIENYKCIRKYEDTCILFVITTKLILRIEGTGLMIDYYTDVEMRITGTICKISFF